MDDQLKPCPFCGSAAYVDGADDDGFYVECAHVGCHVRLGAEWGDDGEPCHFFETKAEATTAWNTRVDTEKGTQ